jgi:hypothetical protein
VVEEEMELQVAMAYDPDDAPGQRLLEARSFN